MVKRKSIEFRESRNPISGHITKFGGQPAWLAGPQWPLNRTTGNPMRFIGQVVIDPELFGPASPQMAYLFMTDEEEDVDGTWEANGGENALVLQPGHVNCPNKPLAEGPSLYRMAKKLLHKKLVPEPCEFAVTLDPGSDPDLADDAQRMKWDDSQNKSYVAALEGNKIGGTPMFIQNPEFPRTGALASAFAAGLRKGPFFSEFRRYGHWLCLFVCGWARG